MLYLVDLITAMNTPKIAIIDAYSLLYRAFFALPPLTNKQGEVTNAAYGFTMMLVKLLDEQDPEYLAVAIDMPVATFRHKAYEAYKAQRAPMPDDLRPQVAMMREILDFANGGESIRRTDGSVPRLIAELEDSVRPLLEAKDICLNVESVYSGN